MSNLLEGLNKEQEQAVTHNGGPLLIVAGAGTGKTTVVTKRIAYIIEQGWAKTDEILALTFTEKAAQEMEERVDKLLPFGYVDLWISTFHSFGERILREHAIEIGLPGNFKLLNEYEQWAMVRRNLDKFNLDYYRPLGNPTKFIHDLVKNFSRLKDEDVTADEYLAYVAGLNKSSITNYELRNEEEELEIKRIAEVANAYKVYQQLLLDNSALDFGDLINYCLKLFRERPNILAKYKNQFKYILLDEFQDTNLAQYELIKLLAAGDSNLVVVGDDDQSIYKFRGGSVANILHFKTDYPQAQELVLTNNYRNKQNILDLSYDFIQHNNPNRLEYQLQQQGDGKLSKKLKANIGETGAIELLEGTDLEDEIRLVVEKMADLKVKDKEANWGDFGILVRANDSANDVCVALEEANLPYVFYASRGLYNKPVIMDAVAYLRMLDNYHESIYLYRVLNFPIFKFTHKELVDLNHLANKKSWSLFEALKNAGQLKMGVEFQKKAAQVLDYINSHTQLVKTKTVREVLVIFLNEIGYLKYLMNLPEKQGREQIGYLNKFIKRVLTFEVSNDDKSVKNFLSEFRMELESGEQGSVTPDVEAGPETIKVMTIHGSKGLEFKYVFIVGMVDKRFPTIERKDKILIPDALIKEDLPQGDMHIEEERRLFYVAATRAKAGLYFSWSKNYGGTRDKKPSRFLLEAGLVKEEVKKTKKDLSAAEEESPVIDKILQLPRPAGDLPAVQQAEGRGEGLSVAKTDYVPPKHYSYTQLTAFSSCPYQYRFAHILKIPRQGKGVFSFGRTMHSTLQKLFELVVEKKGFGQQDLFTEPKKGDENVAWEEVMKIYEESWIDDWYNDAEQKEEYRAKGKDILKTFYAKHKDNWPAIKHLEKGFNIKLKSDENVYTIRGVVDRVDAVDGKVRIVDYKTGNPKDKLTFEDKAQLFIYQIAAEEIFGYKVDSLVFYYLDDNSEMEFIGKDKDLEKLKANIVENIKEINKGEFPAKPSILCKYCDFNDICEFRKL